MAKLLIFGDSWAYDSTLTTWPERLGERWGWRALNMAQGHSGSADLDAQRRQLLWELSCSDLRVDEDAVAITHTGGNDLYFASPKECAAIALAGCCPCSQPPRVARSLSANMARHVSALLALGVRTHVIVGVPLSASMPFIAAPAAAVPFMPESVMLAVARSVMRASNDVLLAAMRTALDQARQVSSPNSSSSSSWETEAKTMAALSAGSASSAEVIGVVVDEALAIDSIVARGSDGKGSSTRERWWEDVSHPSQALHDALAEEMQRQVRNALDEAARGGAMAAPSRGGHVGEAASEEQEEEVVRLLAFRTPAVDVAMS